MMNGGLSVGTVTRNPALLITFLLAIPAWIVAFAGQCAAEAAPHGDHSAVGTVWFGIWVQLFVIIFFVLAALSDGLIYYRLQLIAFTILSVVYAVTGAHSGIYDKRGAWIAFGVGWLVLAIIDIIWLFYLTSEDGTFIGDALGSNWGGNGYGGARRTAQMNDMGGYHAESVGLRNGAADRGMVSHDLGTTNGRYMMENSYSSPMNGMAGSPAKVPQMSGGGMPGDRMGPGGGMGPGGMGPGGMGPGGMGPGASHPAPVREVMDMHSTQVQQTQAAPISEAHQFRHKARANYAYSASPDDPNEVSFAKGDILDVVDTTGKWYQVRTPAGQVGIAPSNYLTLL